MRRVVTVVLLGLAVLLGVRPAAGAQGKVAVFVGPQIREGLADVDSGVIDAIKDVQRAISRSPAFTLAKTVETATISLTILRRRTNGDSGSVGIPIGTTTYRMAVSRRAIDSVIHYGTYERPLTSESGEGNDAWKAAANAVVNDLAAWVIANRGLIQQKQ